MGILDHWGKSSSSNTSAVRYLRITSKQEQSASGWMPWNTTIEDSFENLFVVAVASFSCPGLTGSFQLERTRRSIGKPDLFAVSEFWSGEWVSLMMECLNPADSCSWSSINILEHYMTLLRGSVSDALTRRSLAEVFFVPCARPHFLMFLCTITSTKLANRAQSTTYVIYSRLLW